MGDLRGRAALAAAARRAAAHHARGCGVPTAVVARLLGISSQAVRYFAGAPPHRLLVWAVGLQIELRSRLVVPPALHEPEPQVESAAAPQAASPQLALPEDRGRKQLAFSR